MLFYRLTQYVADERIWLVVIAFKKRIKIFSKLGITLFNILFIK